jgi:hypothetical protein
MQSEEQIYDGYINNVVHHDGYKRLYGEKPFSDWGDYKLTFCGTHATRSGGRLLSSTARRLVGEPDGDFIEILARIKYIPNGQLKNFLVACRTFHSVPDGSYIAVVGSKAHEGSGSWHKYLAYFLSEGRSSLHIDFIDPNEVEGQWEHEVNGCKLHLRWIPEMVKSEDVTHYDAVSSDVWSYEDKTNWGRPDVPIYSLKGGSQDYVPYLHFTETRFFSSKPSGFSVKCPCLICSACSDCVTNWQSFIFLRTLCARMGCPSRCRGLQWVYDQNTLSDLRQDLLMGQGIENVSSNFRYVMALSTEEAIEMGTKTFFKGTKIRSLDPRTKDVGVIRQGVYTGLEGKNVGFIGVNPSILGGVKCNVHSGSYGHRDYDAIFVSGLVSWLSSFSSDIVYCPERPDIIEKNMIAWRWSGQMISEFYEYVPVENYRLTRVPSLTTGKVKSLKVRRRDFHLVDYDGSNPVFANGREYCVIDPKNPPRDERTLLSGVFYMFEDMENLYQKIKKFGPSFTVKDLRLVCQDYSYLFRNHWFYSRKVKIRIIRQNQTETFEGHTPLDYFRSRGYMLSSPWGPIGLLSPLDEKMTYLASS